MDRRPRGIGCRHRSSFSPGRVLMRVYTSGELIDNRFEVVQGPAEQPHLAGGMGRVYLCLDQGDAGRPVALKTFHSGLELPHVREHLLREATMWAKIGHHPNIVRARGVHTTYGNAAIYILLDVVRKPDNKSSPSLRAWLEPTTALPLITSLRFALYIARGMKHATSRVPGLVHGDLKPENVLIDFAENARINRFRPGDGCS